METKLYKKFITLLLAALITIPAIAQDKTDSIDIFLKDKMLKQQIPGMQVAVIQHGKIVKLSSYGLASIEHNITATNESVFSVNSITKAFVGVAIMQLSEEGKLNVNDPISKYIDSIPENWRAITLKQILSNTSGLPNIIDEEENVLGNGIENEAWRIVKTLPTEFKPGEKFSYNQTGYVILGKIINKLSGMHFTKFIEERQFKVAGMKQTQFGDGRDVIPHYAGAYRKTRIENGIWIRNKGYNNAFINFPVFFRTASGILSTANEMAKWIIALQSGRLLKQKQSIETMWTAAILNNGNVGGFNSLTNGYALGWPTVTRAEHPALGPVGGGRSALFVYPKDDLTVIILTNLMGANPEYLIDEVASYYLPDMHESNGFGLPAAVKKLRTQLIKSGFNKASVVFSTLKKKDPGFTLLEYDLNSWAYKLLEQNKKAEAIAIFRLNVKLYPQSANTYDSLAEILELTDDKQGALKNYKRSLELNPKNTNAAAHIKELNNIR